VNSNVSSILVVDELFLEAELPTEVTETESEIETLLRNIQRSADGVAVLFFFGVCLGFAVVTCCALIA
jgi:hypothetical protein